MAAAAGTAGVPKRRAFGRTSAAVDVHRAADEVTSGGASFVTVVQAADFGRVADSGNLAGQIDRVSSLLLPGNNAFTPVLTAVRSSQSQRLKLILWHLNKT